MEEWRPTDVLGYEVSSAGRVRGRRVPFLKPTLRDLYLEVHLGRGMLRRVHRLVAEAFLPREAGRDVVDHINRDKTDNRVENLRWVTDSENKMNKDAQSNSKSGHKNISWDATRNLWRLCIKDKTYGRYVDLDDALLNREEILSRA